MASGIKKRCATKHHSKVLKRTINGRIKKPRQHRYRDSIDIPEEKAHQLIARIESITKPNWLQLQQWDALWRGRKWLISLQVGIPLAVTERQKRKTEIAMELVYAFNRQGRHL